MKEHDMVIFIKPHLNHPVGTLGCIIHAYPSLKAVEVEVLEGDGSAQVSTVEPDKLMMHPNIKTKGAWEAMKTIVNALQSGDITVDQLRDATKKVEDKAYRYTQDLWDADADCDHDIVDAPGGGVKCTKCTGWYCL
jgi:hypothetical protein